MLTHWWAVRVSKPLGLLPTCWQVKPDPGVSARLLAGRPGSECGCRAQGSQSSVQLTGVPEIYPMSDEHTFLFSLLSKSLAFFCSFSFLRTLALASLGTPLGEEVLSVPSHSLVFLFAHFCGLTTTWCGICCFSASSVHMDLTGIHTHLRFPLIFSL